MRLRELRRHDAQLGRIVGVNVAYLNVGSNPIVQSPLRRRGRLVREGIPPNIGRVVVLSDETLVSPQKPFALALLATMWSAVNADPNTGSNFPT